MLHRPLLWRFCTGSWQTRMWLAVMRWAPTSATAGCAAAPRWMAEWRRPARRAVVEGARQRRVGGDGLGGPGGGDAGPVGAEGRAAQGVEGPHDGAGEVGDHVAQQVGLAVGVHRDDGQVIGPAGQPVRPQLDGIEAHGDEQVGLGEQRLLVPVDHGGQAHGARVEGVVGVGEAQALVGRQGDRPGGLHEAAHAVARRDGHRRPVMTTGRWAAGGAPRRRSRRGRGRPRAAAGCSPRRHAGGGAGAVALCRCGWGWDARGRGPAWTPGSAWRQPPRPPASTGWSRP